MANELKAQLQSSDTGLMLKCGLWNAAGQVRTVSGGTFGAFSLGSIANYEMSVTELGFGLYACDMPAVSAGDYTFRFWLSSTKELLSAGSIAWDGSAEIGVRMIDTVADSIATSLGTVSTRVLLSLPNASPGNDDGLLTKGTDDGQILTSSGGVIVADYLNPSAAKTTVDGIKAKTDTITDIYHALIQFTRDQSNTQDEYTVQWFKNGAPVTAGITSPTIQVVKRSDGSDLVASTAMTQIGSTGAYKFTTSVDAERVTKGEAALAVLSATIDGSARPWRVLVGRDST